MLRSALLFLVLAVTQLAHGQEKPADPLDVLRQSADKTAVNWGTLATTLEQKIATLLPCDPKSRAAVEEVSRASEARLSALSAYLRSATARATADTDGAKRVLAAQAALSGGWVTERDEASQEHVAIEAQAADLKESMRKRGSLSGAEQVLIEIANAVKERAAKSEEQVGRRDLVDILLGDLVVAYKDRQTALENESALLDAETVRWNSYYSARLSRAITECAIINPSAPPRKKRP